MVTVRVATKANYHGGSVEVHVLCKDSRGSGLRLSGFGLRRGRLVGGFRFLGLGVGVFQIPGFVTNSEVLWL